MSRNQDAHEPELWVQKLTNMELILKNGLGFALAGSLSKVYR